MAFWIISARDHTPKGSQMKTCDRTLMLRGSTTTHENRIDKATVCGPKNIRSYWDPGSFETSSSMSEPSNALPRFRTLCTNSKNPR